MIELSEQTEGLARRLAVAQSVSIEVAIRDALEARACEAGLDLNHPATARMTAKEMLALGAAISAQPLRDSRSPNEIMDDLNS